MKIRALLSLFILCMAALMSAGGSSAQPAEGTAKVADAKPGDLRLFVSGAFRAAILAVQPRLEKATGRKMVMESSESRALQREIDAGQPFEVAVLTTPVIKDLMAKGKAVPGSDIMVGAVRVGVSVRGDAPKLDVSTPERLKSAILGARSIRRFYGVAASVPTLENLFTKLDLNEATKDKMVHLGGGQTVPEDPLPAGQYELIINLISAIKPMPGWIYLGPIPEQFQMPVMHSAAIGAGGDLAVGRKVTEILQSPEFAAARQASGVDPQ